MKETKRARRMTAFFAAMVIAMGMTGCGSKADDTDKKERKETTTAAESVIAEEADENAGAEGKPEAVTVAPEESAPDESESGGLMGRLKKKKKTETTTSEAQGGSGSTQNKKPVLKQPAVTTSPSESEAETTTTTSAAETPTPSAGTERAVQPELAVTIDGNYIPLPCDVSDLYGFSFDEIFFHESDVPANSSASLYYGEGDQRQYIGNAIIEGNYTSGGAGRLLSVSVGMNDDDYSAEYMGFGRYSTVSDVTARFGDADFFGEPWGSLGASLEYDIPGDAERSKVVFSFTSEGTLERVTVTFMEPRVTAFPDF